MFQPQFSESWRVKEKVSGGFYLAFFQTVSVRQNFNLTRYMPIGQYLAKTLTESVSVWEYSNFVLPRLHLDS